MVLLELFSGIGGFSKGLEAAGYTFDKVYFSEIDKHAIANYKYNYPNAKYIGSVTDILPGDFRGIDIITFGSPCQDFSFAGKRKGLEGERSSLIEYAIRMVTDIRPSVFIWENVKGAFSSNSGADFWAILQAFANIGNYRLEWQLLNTKWFLPQNRERIYLVGHLATSERGFGNVFPIGENDFETRRGREGKGVAQTLDCSCNQAVIGAFRGRNPENPKSRESGLPTEQMLEINKEGVSNTLTSGHKDNVVLQIRDGRDNRSCLRSGRVSELGYKDNSIRRLTEIECERLQGFPDNFTEYGNYDGVIKKIPKTQRYKMLGNAVTVKVVEEIAKRLNLE